MNWSRARGWHVWVDGRKLIDCTSSIYTQNFGHSNPNVISNIKKQLEKCTHSFDFDTPYRTEFENKLSMFTGFPNSLILTTGAEAIEAAIKLVIHNGYTPVGFKGAMHGRTVAAESLVGKRNTVDFEVYDNIEQLKGYTFTKTAFFVEGYRGYDVRRLTESEIEILEGLQALGNIIVFDEIQSGFYRTSAAFVHYLYGICPDVLVVGKSIGGGLPISAVCYDGTELTFEGLEITTTHGQQPLQMAAGCGILDFIFSTVHSFAFSQQYEESCLLMDIMFEVLRQRNVEANNIGMVGSIHVGDDAKMEQRLRSKGVLVMATGKGWIKVAPPITISYKALLKALQIITHEVEEMANE